MTPADRIARQIRIEGRVQGVGFRPFIFRLASQKEVSGWVQNCGGAVELHVEATVSALESFLDAIQHEGPTFSEILSLKVGPVASIGFQDFTIRASHSLTLDDRVLPPDQAICWECLNDLSDPKNPRYRYAFTHCTQCGPRYTLIRGFPLDREHTAMADFLPCRRCQMEYQDPLNRRHHAQNICCPECGPRLRFSSNDLSLGDSQDTLEAALSLIRSGGILAAKGMGGYHLICDARSISAIENLRVRKHRPHRPLGVMMHPDVLKKIPSVWSTPLNNSSRSLVLVPRTLAPSVAEGVAPGLSEIGLMLPDSPLHHLLAEGFHGPLVMTSANLSGDPMLTDAVEAERALSSVADGFLHHDRAILRPADDAVFRSIGGRFRPLRLGRGVAPLIQALRQPVSGCLLAVGGDLKNTVALAHEDRVVISPHLGDLVSSRGLEVFTRGIQGLCALLGLEPDRVACDAHPDYRSSLWAQKLGLPLLRIPHHYAHASALYEEMGLEEPLLTFTFDGLGFGPDGSLWGGEALWGQPGTWQRVAGLRPLKLPGGDRASREPWRMAMSVAFEIGLSWPEAPAGSEAIVPLLETGVQVSETSSVGRLFDAAAALTGICLHQSYEGQAAMQFEAISTEGAQALKLPLLEEAGLLRWDWGPLIPCLLDSKKTPAERGSIFHATLAQAVTDLVLRYREKHGITAVGLTGGVFQNNLLTLEIQQRLEAIGVKVLLPERLPLNDAGLSFGQVVEAEATQREKMGD